MRVRVHAFPSTWFIDPSIDRTDLCVCVGKVSLSVLRSSYRAGVIEPDLRVDRRLIYGELGEGRFSFDTPWSLR